MFQNDNKMSKQASASRSCRSDWKGGGEQARRDEGLTRRKTTKSNRRQSNKNQEKKIKNVKWKKKRQGTRENQDSDRCTAMRARQANCRDAEDSIW